MKKPFLEIGKILKTHGLNGAVKVQHWCDDSSVFKNFDHVFFDSNGEFKAKINFLSLKDSSVVLKFDGIDTIEKANQLIGKILFANRSSFNIPKGRSFIQDLIGTSVVNYLDANLCYGKITNVLNYGANDIYVVKNFDKKEYLIPVIDEIVISKDLDKNLVFIKPMEGLFDV